MGLTKKLKKTLKMPFLTILRLKIVKVFPLGVNHSGNLWRLTAHIYLCLTTPLVFFMDEWQMSIKFIVKNE